MKIDRSKLVIEELEQGFIPYELDYKISEDGYANCKIEWHKLKYDFWNTRDFWASKMPSGLIEQFPCLDYMVDELIEYNKGKTPLDEIIERQKQK
jgi:hypothetical protein